VLRSLILLLALPRVIESVLPAAAPANTNPTWELSDAPEIAMPEVFASVKVTVSPEFSVRAPRRLAVAVMFKVPVRVNPVRVLSVQPAIFALDVPLLVMLTIAAVSTNAVIVVELLPAKVKFPSVLSVIPPSVTFAAFVSVLVIVSAVAAVVITFVTTNPPEPLMLKLLKPGSVRVVMVFEELKKALLFTILTNPMPSLLASFRVTAVSVILAAAAPVPVEAVPIDIFTVSAAVRPFASPVVYEIVPVFVASSIKPVPALTEANVSVVLPPIPVISIVLNWLKGAELIVQV